MKKIGGIWRFKVKDDGCKVKNLHKKFFVKVEMGECSWREWEKANKFFSMCLRNVLWGESVVKNYQYGFQKIGRCKRGVKIY